MPDQKVVLITGASSGIGSATAEHLVSRGYRVFGAVVEETKRPKPSVYVALDSGAALWDLQSYDAGD